MPGYKDISVTVLLAGLLVVSFSACGKREAPAAPTPLPNAFKIIDLKYSLDDFWHCEEVACWIYAEYANNTNSPVELSGALKFSELNSTTYSLFPLSHGYQLPAGPGKNGQWESAKEIIFPYINHNAPHMDFYTIEVDVTANFSNGPITSTFFKDISIE